MFHIIFIHSSVDGHLRCFYILAIVNSAVVYTGIHVYFWIMMFSGLFSGVGLLLARRLFTSRSSGMKIAANENRTLLLEMWGLESHSDGWFGSWLASPARQCVCACSVVSDSLQHHGLYSLPGSSIHGMSQARILKWAAISFSRGCSWFRDWTRVSCLAGVFFTIGPPGKPADGSWIICVVS